MYSKTSVSLEEKHRRIIRRYGKKIGVPKFSSALQAMIVRFEQYEQANGNGNGHHPTPVEEQMTSPAEPIPA
jgi:hypothetical protein